MISNGLRPPALILSEDERAKLDAYKSTSERTGTRSLNGGANLVTNLFYTGDRFLLTQGVQPESRAFQQSRARVDVAVRGDEYQATGERAGQSLDAARTGQLLRKLLRELPNLGE